MKLKDLLIEKVNLKKIEGMWDTYKSGKRDSGFPPAGFSDENAIRFHVEKKTGQKVHRINRTQYGKTYPYNRSNPYSHDEYDIELADGTKFKIQRQYGTPAWTGNVTYTERISII